jgi:hypothetical protein
MTLPRTLDDLASDCLPRPGAPFVVARRTLPRTRSPLAQNWSRQFCGMDKASAVDVEDVECLLTAASSQRVSRDSIRRLRQVFAKCSGVRAGST